MPFDPYLAAIRFGCGLSPRHEPPASVDAMIAGLRGPDAMAARWPIPGAATVEPRQADYAALSRAIRDGSEAEAEAAREAQRLMRARARVEAGAHARATLARLADAEDSLRERLALFWADHFTVQGKNVMAARLVAPFAEEAIRPHLSGRFADMLMAATTHPAMLSYLDQSRSVGPDSPMGERSGRGLNENLARELLELHTLGAGGPYGQADVRELAELLTGLGTDAEGATTFRPQQAQPGGETVLGVAYPEEAGLGTIRAALEDLAAHPATAAHLARKLAVHFVADAPPEALVADLTDAFLASGGSLGAVTEALLRHPLAWEVERRKVRRPVEFLGAALRALGIPGDFVMAQEDRAARRLFLNPMAQMGQPWGEPPGPDGWPEEEGAWATPQGMAARIDWAMNRPEEMIPDLPDPRAFAQGALGPFAPEVALAAGMAERPSEGVGVVLASAAFNRR